jgi:hypothetical protein
MATSPSTLDNSLSTGGTNSQGLANWVGPYVTDMLGKTQALSAEPYQTYKGPLTADQSSLQSAAFTGLAGLTVPTGVSDATTTAGNVAKNLAGQSYKPTTFSNDYAAPAAYQNTSFSGDFTAPQAYQAGAFKNAYAAPVGQDFTTAQVQNYMNPYLQAALEPQLAEARRQALITQTQNASRLAQAGAFGGSRQAIMDAENQRNLGTNLANITGQGYNTAYTNAASQFNADQARKIQEAQLQAQYGLSAEQAAEASRQFAAQQGMTSAQTAAQYGLAEKQAAEASKQFGAQQKMTASQLAAQYGLSAKQAEEASKQFGANYNTQAQQAALQAAQTQANLASLQSQLGLNNINAQLAGGAQQRGITSEGIAADKAEFEKQRQYPYEQLKFQQSMLSGLPVSSVTNTPGQMSDLGALLAGLGGAGALASAGGYSNVADLLSGLYKGAGTASDAVTSSDLWKSVFGG